MIPQWLYLFAVKVTLLHPAFVSPVNTKGAADLQANASVALGLDGNRR